MTAVNKLRNPSKYVLNLHQILRQYVTRASRKKTLLNYIKINLNIYNLKVKTTNSCLEKLESKDSGTRYSVLIPAGEDDTCRNTCWQCQHDLIQSAAVLWSGSHRWCTSGRCPTRHKSITERNRTLPGLLIIK